MFSNVLIFYMLTQDVLQFLNPFPRRVLEKIPQVFNYGEILSNEYKACCIKQ